jgi:hypothetical protein
VNFVIMAAACIPGVLAAMRLGGAISWQPSAGGREAAALAAPEG